MTYLYPLKIMKVEEDIGWCLFLYIFIYFMLYCNAQCAVDRWRHVLYCTWYTVQKVINFQRYNMKCSGENATLRGIFHVVSRYPLYFMLYRGNFDCFSNSVG